VEGLKIMPRIIWIEGGLGHGIVQYPNHGIGLRHGHGHGHGIGPSHRICLGHFLGIDLGICYGIDHGLGHG